jgi:DTW domain-containing protein YfiP
MVVATSPLALVGATAKAQRVVAGPSVDAVSATEAVDAVIIRGSCKGVRSIIALDGSWREARVVVLGNPVYSEELPSGV